MFYSESHQNHRIEVVVSCIYQNKLGFFPYLVIILAQAVTIQKGMIAHLLAKK